MSYADSVSAKCQVFVSEKLRNLKKLPQKLPQIRIGPVVGGCF